MLLLSGMTLVGTYVALSRPLTAAMPVFLLAWLRFGIAAIVMLPWTLAPIAERTIGARQWGTLFLMSLFGNFLFSIFMLEGVAITSAATAGVVLSTLPAVVALFCRIFLGERLAARGWAAVALAVTGVAVLALGRETGADTGLAGTGAGDPLAGVLLLAGCVACEASYVVFGKRLATTVSPMRISALINLFGFALMTPFGLAQALDFDFAALPAATWALLVFYSVSASVVATWLWLTGLTRVPAAHSGVFTIALPLAASLVGVFWLGERFGAAHALALGFAAAGIALVAWPTAAADDPTPSPARGADPT